MVISCQSPPSAIGASESPYSIEGGAMLIVQGFQVPCWAAPQRMRAVPRMLKNIVVTPKNPT
jgi:hypothetical protein